jgi:hypothetical protein
MYRKIVVLFFVGLAALSFLPSMQADQVVDIGTITYGSYQNIVINQSYDVNLTLIYTPIINDVAFQKLGYNPLTNTTVYYMQTLGIPVDYTFKNDTKPTLFQDGLGQVYRLLIDYRNVTVPSNPLLEPYNNLTLRLNETLGDLSRMNLSMGNLSFLMNASLAAMNVSLINMTLQYNATYHQLQYMSLNASMENTRATMLALGKKNAEELLFRIGLVIMPVIVFFCIVSLYIAKRLRWFNAKEDRRIRKIDSGYSQTAEQVDRLTVKKNDEITNRKRMDMPHDDPVEQQPEKPVAKSKPVKQNVIDKIHGAVDNI